MLGFKGERIVIQILKRKSNIGIIEYKGEEYKGLHEPIVDEETFYLAQECMKKRRTNSHIANDNMLTGLCYCGVCGARMRYQKWGKYHKLMCYSQQKTKEYLIKNPNCDNIKPMAADIESEVEDCFKRFAINIQDSPQTESRADFIEDAIRKSNAKIKKYYSLYAENESENLFELIQEEEKRVKSLKADLEKEREKEYKMDSKKIDEIRHVSDVWDSLTNREKNKVLKECVERITITGDDIEIRFVSF